jgi:glycosyltransferase involved in cell wall biosynthesis
MTRKLYKHYDKIFIVSKTGKEIFDQFFPEFAHKTKLFHNIVSREQITDMAKMGPSFDDNFDGKRVLTVGRVSEEKGQREAIKALKILLGRGYHLKWYFVGDGTDRAYCEQLVDEYGIRDNVVFLGTQTNPYGFMKDCDVYVQPSRHEGFCITLAEALCFNKPIVATNFTGAIEQLQTRENAVVVGMAAQEIADGVVAGLEMDLDNGLVEQHYDELSEFLDLVS